MKNAKTWNLAGFAVGILAIILGIVFLTSPADTYETTSPGRDTTFGADFYTYEYSATRAAASNAAITANNLRELGGKLALYSGFLFILAGALTAVHFGKAYFTAEQDGAAKPAKVKAAAYGSTAPSYGQPASEAAASEAGTPDGEA